MVERGKSMSFRCMSLPVVLAALAFGPQVRAQLGDASQDAGSIPPIAMAGGRMVRGTVSSVAGNRLTLKTDNGDAYQVLLTPNTRLMKGRQPVKAAEVKVGDGVGAMGELDQPNKTVHALFVSLVDAEEIRKMREALGKTWIAGKVTAIDDLKLTILRSDKVSQVIAVDEDTSFKRGGRGMGQMMRGDSVITMPPAGEEPRAGAPGGTGSFAGGESITLADVKIGDQIAAQGSLKSGVFVPAQLAVVDPSQHRRRAEGAASLPPEPKPEPK